MAELTMAKLIYEVDSICGASSWDEDCLKEYKAKYEYVFKKNAPKCKESKVCIDGLRYAFNLGVPYLTIEEKIAEDEKIKIAYKKRFRKPITDFELSITTIYFSRGGNILSLISHPRIVATRTKLGMFAKYSLADGMFAIYNQCRNCEYSKAELDMEEWLDFIRTLCHKYRINEWKKEYYDVRFNVQQGRRSLVAVGEGKDYWIFRIYFLDKDGYLDKFESEGTNKYPRNLQKFEFGKIVNEIDSIGAKIERKTKTK